MKKKIFCLALCLCALLSVCSCKTNQTAQDTTATAEETKAAEPTLDYDMPVVEVESVSYRNIYEDDGMAHTNSYSMPKLASDAEGAVAVNKEISAWYEDTFGIHFSMMDDLSGENVRSGEKYVNVTYSSSVHLDVVAVIIKLEETVPGNETKTTYEIFYYDALTDCEITSSDFCEYCSLATEDIFTALNEAGIKKVTNHSVSSEGVYELVYCTANTDGDNLYDCYLKDKDENFIVQTAYVEGATPDTDSLPTE